MSKCVFRLALLAALSSPLASAQDGAFDLTGHTKYRLTSTHLPSDSLLRTLAGSSVRDFGFDARVNAAWDPGAWDLRADWQVAALYGDTIEVSRGLNSTSLQTLFPRLPDDETRLFDLTHLVTDKGKRAVLHRLDRLSVGHTSEDTVLRFGRQAVTWGNGMIFNTVMDVFNPFDPTAIDKEYKPGDDMLYYQRLRDNGHDLQGVIVFRRDAASGKVESGQGSLALKYHGFAGTAEYEALIGRHFDDTLIGLGGNRDIGGALWRGDVVATLADESTRISVVTSLSHSFTWRGRNVSGVLEYLYNGFGQKDGRYAPAELAQNPELVRRLGRGEVFNLGRHYLGLSALIELTPLFMLTPNLFVNLEDPSALLQIATRNDLGENLLLLGALNVPVGPAGTEFGGIESGLPGLRLSTGPTLYAQLAWYF